MPKNPPEAVALFLIPVLGFFLVGGCSQRPVSRHQEEIRGSFHEMVIVGRTEAQRERILSEAFRLLHQIDGKINCRIGTSEISRINQKGFEKPQEISIETFELIQRSVEFFERTGGAFDITLLPLLKLWGFNEGDPHLPRPEEIQSFLPRVGSDHLLLDPKKRRVGLGISQMEIDLTAIARGYACDQVIQFLKSRGVESALVNVGGTIRVFGRPPDGRPWRIGIPHPRDPTRTLRVLSLTEEALSTRSDNDQFFVVNGRRYSNLLNPRTGYPANESVTVSVVAPSALLADLLSTSLFVLGPQKAPHLAHQFEDVRWYLTYFADGDRFKTLSSEPAA